MKKTIKFIIKSILIVGTWIFICICPRVLFPIFFALPLFKLLLILGLSNAFMSNETQQDKRIHNRFHLSDEFVQGAVVATTISKEIK